MTIDFVFVVFTLPGICSFSMFLIWVYMISMFFCDLYREWDLHKTAPCVMICRSCFLFNCISVGMCAIIWVDDSFAMWNHMSLSSDESIISKLCFAFLPLLLSWGLSRTVESNDCGCADQLYGSTVTIHIYTYIYMYMTVSQFLVMES